MVVLITGASGFVGRTVMTELSRRGHTIRALAHHRAVEPPPNTTVIPGDLFDLQSMSQAASGCDALIHLVGIIAERPSQGITFQKVHIEGTRAALEAAGQAGVKRYLHMSALGTRPGAASTYHQTKYAAEQLVQASALDWTIFRPSMIHGPCGDFMRMEARWARKSAPPYFFMPYFGRGFLGLGGAGLLQPVFVGDVARAFADALEKPGTSRRIYDLAGSQRLTWPDLHRISARAIVGQERWVMPIPAWEAKLWTYLIPGALLPFNRDQVIMSQEDNTADLSPFTGDFGWTPGSFAEEIQSYAAELASSSAD